MVAGTMTGWGLLQYPDGPEERVQEEGAFEGKIAGDTLTIRVQTTGGGETLQFPLTLTKIR